MIFAQSDYKEVISVVCDQSGVPLARLARAIGVHRQYLSQVLRHKAHLSDEQAHLAGTFLGLRDDELAYFLLLVQEAKSTNPATRRYFEGRRAALRDKNKELSGRLAEKTRVVRPEATAEQSYIEFFLDVVLQICHAHFSIPRYQKDPLLLAEKLHWTTDELYQAIARLERMDLIERSGATIRSKVPLLHLEASSPLARQNHRNWRVYAAHAFPTGASHDLQFTSTMTSDRRSRQKLVDSLRELIAAFHRDLPGTTDEEAFHLNVDVFRF